MHIVHVANFYGPRSGGIRTTMQELGKGYRGAGHEYTVIVPGRGHAREMTVFGTRITVPSLPLVGTGYQFIPAEGAVRRILAELSPDRIEVSDRLTLRRIGIWARSANIPAVMFAHEKLSEWIQQVVVPTGISTRPGGPIADAMNAASLRAYDRIVCTTAYAAEQFELLAPGSVDKIPLGVDLEQFAPGRAQDTVRSAHLGDGDVLLVHAGRLSPEKSPQRSIAALRELRRRGVDARMVVAGDGPSRAKLERLASGLPVTFAGFIADRAELASLIASADVSLNPGPVETFCLSALESLACGTPVVASQSSALPEIVTAGAGELAGPSADSMADSIQRVLDRDPLERREAARRRAEDFPWSATVTRMLALHRRLGELHLAAG